MGHDLRSDFCHRGDFHCPRLVGVADRSLAISRSLYGSGNHQTSNEFHTGAGFVDLGDLPTPVARGYRLLCNLCRLDYPTPPMAAELAVRVAGGAQSLRWLHCLGAAVGPPHWLNLAGRCGRRAVAGLDRVLLVAHTGQTGSYLRLGNFYDPRCQYANRSTHQPDEPPGVAAASLLHFSESVA